MTGSPPLQAWIKVVLGIELLIAALFFLLGWSHTVSLAQGRAAAWRDLVGLSLPLVLVVLAWIAAVVSHRRGNGALPGLLTIVPFPLSLMAFMVLGAV